MSKTLTITTVSTSDVTTTDTATTWYSTDTPIGSTVDVFPLNSTTRVCQGGYGDISTSRVGIMCFPKAKGTFIAAKIQSISLTFDCAKAGKATASRTLELYTSGIQGIDQNRYPSEYIGELIGSFTGNFYNQKVELTFNDTKNSDAFAILKSYFEAGNTTLVMYNGETSAGGSESFSSNYLVVTELTVSVEYEDDHYIFYNDNGSVRKCAVYYNDNGNVRRCAIFYNNGTSIKV